MEGGDCQYPTSLRHHGGGHAAPSSSPSTPNKALHKSLSYSHNNGNSNSNSNSSNNHHNHEHDSDKSRKNTSHLSSRKGTSNKDLQQHHTNNHSHVDTAVGQYNHHNHPHTSMSGINGLMMLIDGLGLALITAATILESYELWKETYHEHWESNVGPISLWLAGKSAQIIGLIFLIGHAATFQMFPDIERFGMFLLTVGPISSMAGSYSFQHLSIPSFLYNRQWMSTETVELIGISILDVSLIDMEEHLVLTAEVIGFIILCCAAMMQFEYFAEQYTPNVFVRFDMIHCSECFGLMILIVVAVGQFKIKLAKHAQDLAKLTGAISV